MSYWVTTKKLVSHEGDPLTIEIFRQFWKRCYSRTGGGAFVNCRREGARQSPPLIHTAVITLYKRRLYLVPLANSTFDIEMLSKLS